MDAEIVKRNFSKFTTAVAEGKIDEIVDFFAEGSTLLVGIASDVLIGKGGARLYFGNFALKNWNLSLESSHTHFFNGYEKAYVHVGILVLRVNEIQSKMSNVRAKIFFTSNWILESGYWKILHLHISDVKN